MCGIAGLLDLESSRSVSRSTLERMAGSLLHRGPDEAGYFEGPGVGLASRRLSIVGLADGRQPVYNEDRSVVAVYNGELFDHVELRARLEARGHVIRSHADSELLVHLWEDYGEEMFTQLKGQFAFALVDLRRRKVILSRDRFGICPLFWAKTKDNWLVFGSEIKAILASGLVERGADVNGLDNIFTFFWMRGHRTAFRGISSLLPGHFLKVSPSATGTVADVSDVTYWDLDFPDQGQEYDHADERVVQQQFAERLDRAVRIRLRADVPVAGYLSGGVDSSTVVAKCREFAGQRFPTYTVRLDSKKLDESDVAGEFANHLGCRNHSVVCDAQKLSAVYPDAGLAYDCPAIDPNSGSFMQLSLAVRNSGQKVVLAGEGADEALAGYPWMKAHKMMRLMGWGPVQPAVWALERLYHYRFPRAPQGEFRRINQLQGGLQASNLIYHMTCATRWWLLSDKTLAEVQQETAYDQLQLDTQRIRRWHPLNQSLYLGYKIQLSGLLHRSDHMALANSVEGRYPFLDEDLVEFCAKVHPRWKVRGLTGDKYLLRSVAAGFLPREVAFRKKAMFRAPTVDTLLNNREPYLTQLLSRESLERTGYFNADAVLKVSERLKSGSKADPYRLFSGVALWAVLGTQLWHHQYLGGGLCDLPEWSPSPAPATIRAA